MAHGGVRCTEAKPASGLGEATTAQSLPIWPNCPRSIKVWINDNWARAVDSSCDIVLLEPPWATLQLHRQHPWHLPCSSE